MPFVRITKKNKINGERVQPGDVKQYDKRLCDHLVRIGHAAYIGDGPVETNDLMSQRAHGWTLEKS